MKFTSVDLINMEVALRLRVEACHENNETKMAAVWERTLKKVQELQVEQITERTKRRIEFVNILTGGKR